MNTNINKFIQLYDMQLHIAEKTFDLLNKYLPYGYSSEITNRAKLKGLKTNDQRVRMVKAGIQKDIIILDLLIDLAKEKQAVAEALTEKLTA